MTISVNDILVNEAGVEVTVKAVTETTATLEWKDGEDLKSEEVPLDQLEIQESKLDKKIATGSRSEKEKAWADKKKKSLKEDESEAMATLHPNTRPAENAKSRLETMTAVIGTLASMKSDELEKWWNDAVALVGKEARLVPGTAEGNRATIKAHPSAAVGEDLQHMFSGQELSEEFKEKASTLFEAALSSRIALETVKLQEAYDAAEQELTESYQALLDEAVDEVTDQISGGLESYLDYVAEEWIKENQVAIESTLRNELMDDFINGLKTLFADHYVDVPEDKVDAFEAAVEENIQLKAELNGVLNENIELKSRVSTKRKEDLIAESSAGLSATQIAKFNDLVSDIEFENEATFTKKLTTIKETYFLNNGKKPSESNIISESFEGEVKEKTVHPDMAQYTKAIARTTKNI